MRITHPLAAFITPPPRRTQDHFHKMVIDVGYVIEAREDEEMPEVLFGSAKMFRPVYQEAPEMFDQSE